MGIRSSYVEQCCNGQAATNAAAVANELVSELNIITARRCYHSLVNGHPLASPIHRGEQKSACLGSEDADDDQHIIA